MRVTQTRFAERAFQKIVLQRQLSDLGVQNFQIDRRGRRLAPAMIENARCAFQQLALPLPDLVDAHVELLHQIGERLLALESGHSHPRIKSEDRLFALNPGVLFRRVRFVM